MTSTITFHKYPRPRADNPRSKAKKAAMNKPNYVTPMNGGGNVLYTPYGTTGGQFQHV